MNSRRWLYRLAWLEPFWVAAVGVLLLLPPRFLPETLSQTLSANRPLLIIALFGAWPLRRVAYGRLTIRTPLDWPLILLMLWLPVTYWASAVKELSWEALGYLLFGLAGYFALINWPPAQRRPQLVGWLIVLLGAGLAMATPLLTELSINKIFQLGALASIFQQLAGGVPGNVNANRVAGTLVLCLPLAAALTLQLRQGKRRWPILLYGLATIAMLGALALTQSRGTYLAVIVALGAVLMLRWPKLVYALPIVIAAGIVVVLIVGPEAILEMLLSGSVLNGMNGRLELWGRALYALHDFPLTGIGIGTFKQVIPVFYPLFFAGPETVIEHAHNLLLQAGVDLGLPGLIAYLAIMINTTALLVRALRRYETRLQWALAAGALGGLIAMWTHGLFDAAVWGSKPAFVPWLLVAVAVLVSTGQSQATATPD